MSKTWTARYDGRCPLCGETINTGDQLTWDDADRAVHRDCERKDTRPARPTCPKCWLEIAANGDCGCDP